MDCTGRAMHQAMAAQRATTLLRSGRNDAVPAHITCSVSLRLAVIYLLVKMVVMRCCITHKRNSFRTYCRCLATGSLLARTAAFSS